MRTLSSRQALPAATATAVRRRPWRARLADKASRRPPRRRRGSSSRRRPPSRRCPRPPYHRTSWLLAQWVAARGPNEAFTVFYVPGVSAPDPAPPSPHRRRSKRPARSLTCWTWTFRARRLPVLPVLPPRRRWTRSLASAQRRLWARRKRRHTPVVVCSCRRTSAPASPHCPLVSRPLVNRAAPLPLPPPDTVSSCLCTGVLARQRVS